MGTANQEQSKRDGSERRLVRMFKALAHPNRFQLFVEIVRQSEAAFEQGHECFLTGVMDTLNIGAPTVSHHLKELVNAELIETERKGKFVTCRVNPDSLDELSTFLGGIKPDA